MKHIMRALRFKIFMLLLLGIIYPLLVTGVGQIFFPQQSSGDFITYHDQIIGSAKIGQNFAKAQYFWSRPSAVNYNPLPSGGSNLGQTSADLKKRVNERKEHLIKNHPDEHVDPPQDLLFASASGLDPHISPEAAQYQLQRVAKARKLDSEMVQKLIREHTTQRTMNILGEPAVNVLELNLALDKIQEELKIEF
jgi:K+-transporting ATPase ATPase C chain